MPTITYAPKKWNLAGLQGISDATLEVHFGLYEGYVKNVNLLNERLASLRASDQAKGADPSYAELVRRLGFEYNGMRAARVLLRQHDARQPKPIGTGKLHEALGNGIWQFRRVEERLRRSRRHARRRLGHRVSRPGPPHHQSLDRRPRNRPSRRIRSDRRARRLGARVHTRLQAVGTAKYVEAFFANVDWKPCESRLPQSGNGVTGKATPT